jgi:hypothetical protein
MVNLTLADEMSLGGNIFRFFNDSINLFEIAVATGVNQHNSNNNN